MGAQDVPDREAQSIEARLARRMGDKQSSSRLEAQAGGMAGMFVKVPEDRSSDQSSAFHVHPSQEHLGDFQKVFRRIRQMGRKEREEDDAASDAMMKALLYKEKAKTSKGGK